MIRNFLRNFMTGRYGPDHLNTAILSVAVVMCILYYFTALTVILVVSYGLLLLALFRMLSRNITKRRRENDKFIRFWWPVRQRFSIFFSNIKDRKTHRYFRCPGCKNTLRVPRGKGKMQITCPKCGERFIKKT